MSAPQLYKTTGIILKRSNTGEGDKIVTVLCPHIGKKRFVAKGIRKINSRRAGHLELFSKTEFLLHKGKMLDYITGATLIHAFGSSYVQLSQVAAAYAATEIIDRMILEGSEHDEAYGLLDGFLTALEPADQAAIPPLLLAFIDQLVFVLGYARKETNSKSLGAAIGVVEGIIERKVRSTNLLARSGITLYP